MIILNFLKKYWLYATLVVVIFVLLIFGGVQKCSSNHTENLITQSAIAMATAHVKDSMKIADLQARNTAIDSTRRVEQSKTQTASNTAKVQTAAANKYMAQAEKAEHERDSLRAIKAPCEQQLEKCDESNSKLNQAIVQKDGANKNLGIKADGFENQMNQCDEQRKNDGLMLQSKNNQIGEVTRINESLTKELKAKDNFFAKNAIWIGVVAGAVVTYLVVK